MEQAKKKEEKLKEKSTQPKNKSIKKYKDIADTKWQ